MSKAELDRAALGLPLRQADPDTFRHEPPVDPMAELLHDVFDTLNNSGRGLLDYSAIAHLRAELAKRGYEIAPTAALRHRQSALTEMREALEKAADRFEHCANLMAESHGISGTLRAERVIKMRHFALETLAALSGDSA